ncbi:MAG: transglycosylase domain-containing protein, partial [Candidatus Rokuibacteriota bacterium]
GIPFATYPGFPHVTAASLPPYVVPLLQAVEDKRFFRHFGVDVLAASSALVSNILGRPRRGASTITMQAVRSIDRRSLMRPSGTWPGKLAEARTAFDLERRHRKDEILDLYLNTVDLGWISGVHILGINHASWTYFGKPASHLTLAEAATLVGMIKGPQLYHPISRPDNSRVRRDAVLHRLATVRPEYVDDAATALGEALATIPFDRIPKPPAVVSLIGRRISGVAPPSVVRSTLDGDLQRAVEGELEALIRDIESGRHGSYGVDPQNSLIGGAIVMDAPTGSVRAYVCGRAMGLAAGWDPCSAGRVSLSSVSKVFLLLTALDLGVVRTGDTLEDVKGRATAGGGSPYLDQICAGHGRRKQWPLERLVAVSDNCFAVALHRLLPPQAFAQLREIGIDVDPTQPASALGTGTISLLELTRLMAGLANGGIVPQWQVLESDGAASPVAVSDRLPFRATTLSTGRKILAGVLQHGTAAGARPLLPPDLPAFAKTGT